MLLVPASTEMNAPSDGIEFPFAMPSEEALAHGLRGQSLLSVPDVKTVHLTREVALSIGEVRHVERLWRIQQCVREGCFELCTGGHANIHLGGTRRALAQ